MGSLLLYKMNMNGIEKIGTIKELQEMTGYTAAYLRQIAYGDVKCPKGITIERLDEGLKQEQNLPFLFRYEWEKTVARFANVQWVKEGGKKLKVKA